MYRRLWTPSLVFRACTVKRPRLAKRAPSKTPASKAVVCVDESLWPWIDAGVPSPLRYKWLRRYWVRACPEVGLAHYSDPDNSRGYVGPRLHDLRHCLGQWAVAAGVSEAAVQVALRHSTAEMTRRYTKSKNKGEVARAIGQLLTRSAR
jgi:integrase